ncbi:DUF4249 domain-containing protein [Spirosoma validum]|uniref:DUF4249 domain-containing protein n=1 Tax=Spirosoma validum TaxID=2771355 RepID=A0A927GGT5_9BACT|nr:DUF4249 domain-containing protein [Spirosoma validum]MBD2757327.1 DUF4249 domain-containing protein [Spirosoma validum]
MKNSPVKLVGWFLILLVGGCVDPYRPPEITAPDSYLVVNGFFNSAPGTTTTIQLSRSQNLADPKTPTAETKARVTIESAHNASYALAEGSAGVYSMSGVTPLSGETYRLHIKTAKGLDYYSDYVPVVTTPPIDSLSWRAEDDGVQINVNTHDPQNNTHYYRWEFDETWEYTAGYNSSYVYNDKTKGVDLRNENIYNCWGSSTSKNIITTSTTRLSRDVVSQFPLNTIAGSSIKFQSKYSILVRQYALSQAGYDYYDQLAKITQNIGSIFDPQPSQITGNIRSATNPTDLVLGFFRVGSVVTKRIYIRKSQLPSWRTLTGYESCVTDTLTLRELQESPTGVVTTYYPPPPGSLQYITAPFACIDCRLRGGVNKKPDFWEN